MSEKQGIPPPAYYPSSEDPGHAASAPSYPVLQPYAYPPPYQGTYQQVPPGYPQLPYSVSQPYGPAGQQPQQGAQHTVIVQNPQPIVYAQQPGIISSVTNQVEAAVVSAVRSGNQLVSGTAPALHSDISKNRVSPVMDCFLGGSGIQLLSRACKTCLRVLPDGSVDANGAIGNDYSSHFLVVKRENNIVVLRNGCYPQYHLTMVNKKLTATGTGDKASHFKVQETFNHYVTLEHEGAGGYVGVDTRKNVLPGKMVNSKAAEGQFEVVLVYSPVGHRYHPVH